jgi:hypothetical protein
MQEAVRLARKTTDAELRVALILLDSAAELLMHRLATDCVEQRRWAESTVDHYRHLWARFGIRDRHQMQQLVDAEARILSKSRVKKIDREFDAKADLIVEEGLLSDGQARCLKKLHQYRNATYHRDHLRSRTLLTSVRIYVYVAFQMMIRFPVSWMAIIHPTPVALSSHPRAHWLPLGTGSA